MVGTTVIDASRNLTNIGTIGSGAITSSAGISGTTLTASTSHNTSGTGVYQVAGTTVINSSRNLTNIGTIGCGAITSSAGISGTTGSFSGIITLPSGFGTNDIGPGTGDGASYSTYNIYIRTWFGLAIRDYGGTVRMVADARSGTWDVIGGYKINGTTVIDSSRNLTNIGTISSGAITTAGSLTFTGNATRLQFNSTSTWSGDAGTGFGKLEYHSNRWYVNAGSDCDRIVQFRKGVTDVSHIDTNGTFIGNISGSAANATYAGTAGYCSGNTAGSAASATNAGYATNAGTAGYCSGNTAGSAANATYAGTAGYCSGASRYLYSTAGNGNWNWSGQGGQPTWLWGSNDGNNMYVWNPSNFSVGYAGYAGSAASATNANTAGYCSGNTGGSANSVNGSVTIGGSGYPIYVSYGNSTGFGQRRFQYGSGTPGLSFQDITGYQAWNVGAYVNGWIWAASSGFMVNSDRRAKKKVDVNKLQYLEKVNNLEVVNYKWIDDYKNGGENAVHTGFFAQDVENVIPEAVTRQSEFLPDIYRYSEKIEGNVITCNDHGLTVGDWIKFFPKKDDQTKEYYAEIIKTIDTNTFECKPASEITCDRVFLYGKEINDYRTLCENKLTPYAIGAIQELTKMVLALTMRVDQLETNSSNVA